MIKYFESTAPKADETGFHHGAALFTQEAAATAKLRTASPFWYFTYAKAFACVYWLVGATGITRVAILTL